MEPGVALDLPIELDGRRAASTTRFLTAGAYVIVIGTVLPHGDLALELHSTYVGHPGVATHSTHLQLGLARRAPQVETATHDEHDVDVLFRPRSCLYDHAQRLSEYLQDLGHEVRLHITDDCTAAVEAIR